MQLAVEPQYTEEKIDTIVQTYRETLGLMNQVFDLLYDDVCGPCIEYGISEGTQDNSWIGRGCCNAGSHAFEGMEGPVAFEIARLRCLITADAIREGKILGGDNICMFHEKDEGCIVPDLKSPKCARYFCILPETEEKYGIDYNISMIDRNLKLILNGEDQEVEEFHNYLNSMISSIKAVQGAENE